MCLANGAAQARDNIEINYNVDGQTGQRGFSTVQGIVDALSGNALNSVAGSYTPNSPATADMNIRGIQGVASYAANSPALRVQIPVAGLDRTFQGATREASARLFQRYLEGSEGSGTLNNILRAGVHSSPIDPVAGGPNSALTQLSVTDFSAAANASAGRGSGFGIGARIGGFTAAGYDSYNMTLPIDASWRITERDTLSFDLPLAYTNSGGATSYAANGGVLYRRQVTEDWQMQFSGRVGAAGSIELGAGSGIYGLGMVSSYRFALGDAWRMTVVNAINYVSTFPASIGSISVNYNVANTVFRNGIIINRDLDYQLAGFPLSVSGYAVDTRFAGSPVYVRNFQEFGVFVAPGRESRFGVGLQLMTGDRGLFGVTMSTGIRF
ncbi:hypothetical protein [Sediminicoccus sp. KRV36]|uniref:hypothetical protein n=1 Tax=Sediminicoccus sp. KRV36 TaxID=3133721 RepID=UPI00200F6551|nr:hypothetical protein [Sediminicoccus rosea]UPY38525.1 hypothetical protein LHU95_07475 [Sediminicoccus rosea]